MVRFVHAADFQIGKPYNWANGRAQKTLRERREQAIEQVGEVAAESQADFIVVAGDFFDANTIEDDVITRACRRLSSLNIPTYILPGNHDFAAGPASVYERSTFERLRQRSWARRGSGGRSYRRRSRRGCRFRGRRGLVQD